jgi:anti-anti-sigma factor
MRTPPLQRLEIPADEARLCEVRDFVDRAAAACGFTARAAANVRLAVDEACTNVVKHAYAGRAGSLSIACAARRGWFEVRILDQGTPFEGRVDLQQLGTLVETKRKGGLGVFLMHRLMDEVRYQTTPAGNEWILRKRLPRPTSTLARRLHTRWAVRAAAGLVAVTIVAVTPLWRQIGRERDQAEMNAVRAHAFGLAEAARPLLVQRTELTPEQTHLFEVVLGLARQEPRLLSIDVVDNDGTIWAADRAHATFTHYIAPAGLGVPDADGVRTARTVIDGVRVVQLTVPVRVGDDAHAVGAVHLSMRWDTTVAAIRAARLRLVAAALLLDLTALGLVAAALAAFLRPLQRLIDGVRGLSQGERTLAEDGPEEIGAIAQAFNDMHARYKAAAESAAEHERLQEEMRLARDIQAAILPQSVPDIPGYEIARLYRPAQSVGGDYYDFLDAGAGLTGVVVADVAGKGVPGSLVMSMIRTALRMETRRNAHAGDVLARLHQFLSADMRKGMFATMLYVVLDSRHRVLSYASAGHTPMILYRAATDETFCLTARGLPVGLAGSDAAQFERQLDVERLRLRKGDLLLLYTDGITEATNAAGEAYGESRLVAAVGRWGRESAAEFARRLEEDLYAFLGGAAPGDDLTLVAIKELRESPLHDGDLQRKLVDLIETRGMPVADACRRLRVSPSTYYRMRHLQDELEQLPVDKRALLLQEVQARPTHGAAALAATLAARGLDIGTARIEAELRRLGLETEAARTAYAGSAAARAGLALDGAAPAAVDAVDHGGANAAADANRAHSSLVADSDTASQAGLAPDADSASSAASDAPIAADESSSAPVAHSLVELESSLDSASCTAFEARLEAAAATAPVVIVDLARAAYVSSRGWGLLAQAAARWKPERTLVLVGLRPEVREVYRMLGFDTVLRVHADRAAALVSLVAAAGETGVKGAVAADATNIEPVANSMSPVIEASAAPFASVALGGPNAVGASDASRTADANHGPDANLTPDTNLTADAAAASGADFGVDLDWESLRLRYGHADPDGTVTLLVLEGVLDTVSAQRLEPELDALAARGARAVLADMSRVEFVSSAGWGGLANLAASLRERGGALRVFGMHPAVQRIYALLHLDAVLPCHDELASALAALGVRDAAAPKPLERVERPRAKAEPKSPRFARGALRANLEPFGARGRAQRLELHGELRGDDAFAFETWLAQQQAPGALLVVDAASLAAAEPAGWSALARHATALAASGAELCVIAAANVAPPPELGLAAHPSLAAALSARQTAGPLAFVAGAPDDRDATIRSEGWKQYLTLLEQTNEEVQA